MNVGVADNLPGFLAKVAKVERAYTGGAIAAGVAAAALETKKAIAEASGKYATSKLARVGYEISGGNERPQALIRMKSRKAHLLNFDTRPHAISVKRRRRGRPAKALNVRGIGPRASVRHPGTKGKHMWEKGLELAQPRVQKTMRDAVHKIMTDAFDGV